MQTGTLAESDEIPAAALESLQALREIEVEGGVTATQWRVAVDASERTFYRHRASLLKRGWVTNIGTEKTPRYQVVSDAA